MRHQRGLTLVELLVASAIGLAVLSGAMQLFLQSLNSNKRLMLESRLHQDLRAAADLITRDLRRAGHWNVAVQQLPAGHLNPNGDVTASAHAITYRFDSPSAATSQVSFSLSGGRLRMQIGAGSAQALTDTDVMTVTRFDIGARTDTHDLGHLCQPVCRGSPQCPHINQRRYDIHIEAHAKADKHIVRTLDSAVLVRNDHMVGACPGGS